VNLLVHMDARGTPIWVYEQLVLRDGCGPGGAARPISTTGLGLIAALRSATERDLHRSSGSVAGAPGCRLGRFRNAESVKVTVKVKGKQNVLHSCVRHWS
jgi:hypothetical protein